MGCIQSKVVGVHRILDDDKHDIHILDGNEEDYYTAFLEDKVLGAGEFGQVKLCIATRGAYKDMECAVKVIKKGWVFKNNSLLTPLNPEIIRRECKILRKLNGERHTMKLVGLYEGGSEVFIVTEFLAGGEMGDWVVQKETKELRTEDVSRISYELLDALDFFHSKHIIHRDLKPANIMFSDLSDRATLKVIDFGSGTYDAEQPDYKHHTFAGSAFYNSPEIFLQMKKTDKTAPYGIKTDIWSVGVTLYVLVAGYPADKLQKAFNCIQTPPSKGRDLNKLPNLPEGLPAEFIDLISKCTTYKQANRPSAAELMEHDFVLFHKRDDMEVDDGKAVADEINMEAILNVANGGDLAENGKAVKLRTLKSRVFKGSVARHSMYLDFQKYERSLTSLLATMLSEDEYENLITLLESREEVVGQDMRLQVIPVKELKKLIQKELPNVVEMMEKLKGAFLYEDYAYHIAKLRFFSIQRKNAKFDESIGNSSSHHSKILSASDHKGRRAAPIRTKSVHGSDIYKSFAKAKSKRAKNYRQSMINLS